MRKLIFLALLATAATPAFARPGQDDNDARPNRSEQRPAPQSHFVRGPRADAPRPDAPRFDRGPRTDAPAIQQPRAEGPRFAPQGVPGGWQNRGGDPRGGRQGGWAGRPGSMQQPVADGAPLSTPPAGATRWQDHVRTGGGQGSRDRNGDVRSGDPRRYDRSSGGVIVSRGGVGGDYRRADGRRDGDWSGGVQHRRWSNDWRRDSRYDWRGYRNQNRFAFHVGRFYDPFGYGYRPLSIGFTLFSGYYQPDYWIDDPYEYRLPPVYGPYRWVRYYNDAVLVDIYSGEVVDVITDFFW